MDINKELELFTKCRDNFNNSDLALKSLGTLYLTKQLERYISPTLDMSLIVRYILDINSDFSYSNVRSGAEEAKKENKDHVQHEYTHAKMLTDLYSLLFMYAEQQELTEEQAKEFLLLEFEQIYFGEEIVELNNSTVIKLCPAIAETI